MQESEIVIGVAFTLFRLGKDGVDDCSVTGETPLVDCFVHECIALPAQVDFGQQQLAEECRPFRLGDAIQQVFNIRSFAGAPGRFELSGTLSIRRMALKERSVCFRGYPTSCFVSQLGCLIAPDSADDFQSALYRPFGTTRLSGYLVDGVALHLENRYAA